MRHFRFCLALAAAALAVLWGTAAFAAIANTPHDVSTALTKSVCEPCHLPHGATGDRLWATTKSTGTGWGALTISQLCGSCHYGTPAYAGLSGVAHDMTNYAYNISNHGWQTANLVSRASFDNAAMGASGLPYVGGANIQCSTCHNPHENGVRPFLRVATGTVETLCLLCHARNNGDGAAALKGAANSVNGFSQHPVNIPYTAAGNGAPGLRTLDTTLFATSRGTAAKGSISVSDALGGKLLTEPGTSGNMGCPTCHQVHGNGVSATPNAWLLVAPNQISAGTISPNRSALCEACHTGGRDGGTVIAASTKDHPIDNLISNRAHFDFTPWASSAAYESQDATWPKLGALNQAGCTSCHSAHYGLPLSPMQRSYAQTGGSPFNPTPTGDAHNSTAWCDSCHTAASKAPYGHHSVKDNFAASLINCRDCHAAAAADTTIATSQFSAHRNWAGLDLPSAAPVSSQRANFCLKCHAGTAFTPFGGSSTTIGVETLQTGTFNPTTPVGGATFPAIHGTKRGGTGNAVSSHYLGATTKLAAGDNVTTPRTLPWESGFYSVYATAPGTPGGLLLGQAGGTGAPNYPGTWNATDRIICESCHNVMYNVGSEGNAAGITASSSTGLLNNLLLERFEDDAAGTVGGAGSTVGSLLCVGCHGGGNIARGTLNLNTHKPGGTHPVTGSTVTKAVDVGRSPTTLISGSGAVGYANAAGSPGIQSYPAANAMDCDSCHRAHDGAAGSAKAGAIGTGFNYILEQATSTADVQSMCSQCHTY